MTDDEVAQYLIHPALRPRLDEWLAFQGFRVDRLPPEAEYPIPLPTYLVAPDDNAMRWWAQWKAIEAAEQRWEPPTHPGSDPARRGPGPIA